MTIQQLEYIIAVDTCNSFVKASQQCFVTQPTLSMQVQKLEEELNVIIFDRSRQPVVATETGGKIIEQARITLAEFYKIKELLKEEINTLEGELKVGIIPTLAPYLVPLFLPEFNKKNKKIQLVLFESTTLQITEQLKKGILDAGILATPLQESGLIETPLFYEEFVAYLSDKSALFNQKTLQTDEILQEDLILLDEGHCLRTQVLHLCKKMNNKSVITDFKTGSLETIKRLVEIDKGITILPELATFYMNKKELSRVRYFKKPEPVREISLVTHRNYIKKTLLDALKSEIIKHIPAKMLKGKKKKIIDAGL
jgi:LysR family hydrogen peroxide-inducible transcriptional activator